MAEHTPTPWITEEGPHWLSIGRPDAPIEHGQRKSIVATRWSGQVTEEERANAAFIVKAVNNHDALVKALETIRALSGHDNALFAGASALICSRMADIHQHADAALAHVGQTLREGS